MKIGFTYNLKTEAGANHDPEDAFEEFDSPETIDALVEVIGDLGHQCVKLGYGPAALEKIAKDKPDFVFNIAEGYGGRNREAFIPAMLEMLNIPYSGPDPLTAAVTLDKINAKRLASLAGVAVPWHFIIEDLNTFNYDSIRFPAIVKLAYEGSSKGLRLKSKVNNIAELKEQDQWLRQNYTRQPILAEQFITGREMTVGVIGNDPAEILGVMEITPRQGALEDFVYSLEVKRDYLNQVEYRCPPAIGDFSRECLEQAALKLYRQFDCRDAARLDFRLDKNGTLYFIEVNPLPGLHPVSSDLVIMADNLGIAYPHLIARIFKAALTRCGLANGQKTG